MEAKEFSSKLVPCTGWQRVAWTLASLDPPLLTNARALLWPEFFRFHVLPLPFLPPPSLCHGFLTLHFDFASPGPCPGRRPQALACFKFNELVPKMTIFSKGTTVSKAHHFGVLQPLVFRGCIFQDLRPGSAALSLIDCSVFRHFFPPQNSPRQGKWQIFYPLINDHMAGWNDIPFFNKIHTSTQSGAPIFQPAMLVDPGAYVNSLGSRFVNSFDKGLELLWSGPILAVSRGLGSRIFEASSFKSHGSWTWLTDPSGKYARQNGNLPQIGVKI